MVSEKIFKPIFLLMRMKIHTIGGYDEVGKNMTALEIGEDVIIFDDGLFLPAIVGVQEKEKIPTEKGMTALGALPDVEYLEKKGLQGKVRAILVSANIYGTPFTTEVLKIIMEDNGQSIRNKIIPVRLNSSIVIRGKSGKYKVDFVNITHSTIQCSVIAVHTPNGIVMYVNDYKLDNSPTFGEKPNYKKLKELSKQGVKVLIINSLYAPKEVKTPSEKVAKTLLEDVLFGTENRNSAIIVSTFSSHIARLKTISEFGRRLNREVIFLGRSLNKYVTAAKNVGEASFMKKVKMFSYRRQVEKALGRVNKNRSRYLVVCTGHQGEPGSILDRLARDELPLKLRKDDHIIFSSQTIPSPINEETKAQLEKKLKRHHVRIFDNAHVSGHGGREDLRDFINLVKPKHIIPAHGDLKKTTAGVTLAEEIGYKRGKSVHLMGDLKVLEVK